MAIDLRQINQAELSDFVSGIINSSFSPLVAAYLATGQNVGNTVVYITPVNQTISGQKTFALSPSIPYSGGTGQAVSMQYVLDQLASFNLQGIQTFEGGIATDFFLVPPPDSGTGSAINLGYLESLNLLTATGNQIISGDNTFSGNIYVPTASSGWQAVPYNQFTTSGINFLNQLNNTGHAIDIRLNALEAASTAVTQNFQGVLSFNGQKGNIFTQGKGTLTAIQQGNVLILSGALPTGTGYLQGEQGPMGPILHYRNQWATGVTYSVLDWVNVGGISWVSTTGHTSSSGNLPATTGTTWALLASGNGPSGAKGDPSILFNWKGNWNSTSVYSGNDAVFMSGSAFGYTGVSSISGSGNRPIINSNWSIVVQAIPVDPSAFYPAIGNPSNFVINTGQLVTTGMTGQFAAINHSHQYVTNLNGLTGNLSLSGLGGVQIVSSGNQLVISGGAGGSSALSWRGDWNSFSTYTSGDLVLVNNSIYAYLGASSIAGVESNPSTISSKWSMFGDRPIIFHTGDYSSALYYRKNDLARVIGDSGIVTEYICTTDYLNPLKSLHPYGYYNTFIDCDGNTGKNLFEITNQTKAASHPYYNSGSITGFALNDLQPNSNYNGYAGPSLIRGEKYYFDSELIGFPFLLTSNISGSGYSGQYVHGVFTGTRCVANTGAYVQMVTGTAMNSGTLLFLPDNTTPNTVYFQASNRTFAGYKLNVVDKNPWEVFVSGGVGPSGQKGDTGGAGVAFSWRGEWNASGYYIPKDSVYHNGSSWGTDTFVTHLEPQTGSLSWFLIAKSGEQGPSGQNGQNALSFIWRSDWNSGTVYHNNDSVYFNGSSYGSSGTISGTAPTGGAPWFIVAKSGQRGPTGVGLPGLAFAWKGDWSAAIAYSSGDSVYYEGSSYGTSTSTSGQAPPTGPWEIVSRKGGNIFSWRGPFNSGTQYYGGDSVYFNGSSYATLSRTTGEYPTGSSNWFLIAAKGGVGAAGATGPQGQGLNFRGDWSSASTYYSGDIVNYSFKTYLASGIGSGVNYPPNSPWSQIGNQTALFNWRGEYSNTTGYNPYDSVSYYGSTYATLNSPSGLLPDSDSHWFVVAKGLTGTQLQLVEKNFNFTGYDTGIVNGINHRIITRDPIHFTGAVVGMTWPGAGTFSGETASISFLKYISGSSYLVGSINAVRNSAGDANLYNLNDLDFILDQGAILEGTISYSNPNSEPVIAESVTASIFGYYL